MRRREARKMKGIQIVCASLVSALVILAPWYVTPTGYCGGSLDVREIFAEVHHLRKEITLHNLVNGLYLSEDQIVQILAVLRKVAGIREEHTAKAISHARQMGELLTGIRETVARDEEIGGELIREFHRTKKGIEGLREELRHTLMPYEDEIKGVLNENQLTLIEEFKPCVVPPRDARAGTRIGQVTGDTHRGERFLTRVRGMDERAYQRRKSFIIERHIERVERHVGVLPDQERAEEEGRVGGILTKARELSDLDFEAQKGDLARDLKEPHEKAMQSRHRKRKGDLDRVGRFLLNPKLIPILEGRLTQLSAR
jgi:hypothetical protein